MERCITRVDDRWYAYDLTSCSSYRYALPKLYYIYIYIYAHLLNEIEFLHFSSLIIYSVYTTLYTGWSMHNLQI